MKKRTVLLVDDEKPVRGVIREFLESMGILVLEADGAAMATQYALNSPLHFDLLITDVLLPRTNGRDLANRISMVRPDIKVLFISGFPIEVLNHHGLCPTRAELLAKPFTRNELETQVRRVMEHGPNWKSIAVSSDGSLAHPG